VTQTFLWDVYDASGELIRLTLPFEEWSKDAIRTLEGLRPEPASHWQIVTSLTLRGADLQAQPISILRPENSASPIFHLAFDTNSLHSPSQGIHPADDSVGHITESEEQQDVESVEENSAIVGGLLASVEQRLTSIAESGTNSGVEEHRAWFVGAKPDLYRAGFTALGAQLETLTNSSKHPAAELLKARYVLHLHAQANK
jgi:hypothetical protein